MTQLCIDFQGRGEVQTLSRARVQPMRDGVQLALRVPRQVRALGQVLAQQAIRVFVGAPLPRAIRIRKEDPDREPLGQALMLSHLFPSIVGQGLPQQRGYVPEFLREALAGTPRVRPLHPCQENQARRPLHQRADGRAIAGSLDEVALPVAGHRAGRDLGGTLGHRRHVGDVAPSVCSPRPRLARYARLTQRRQQCTPQGSAWQHRQAHKEGLCRKLFSHVVRIRASEASSNLFGRAALSQRCPHILPQPGVQELARSPWLTGSDRRPCLRRASAIGAAPRGVAGRLAAHGAGCASQRPRHHSQRVAVGQAQAQGLTVFSTQVCVAFLWHGNTIAHQGL